MPAIWVKAGSYEPRYWLFNDPDTGDLIDLTQPGYEVTGRVADRPDGKGATLLDLPDSSVWRRTADGRCYFEPSSVTSSTWTFRRGYFQAEMAHPSGEAVRFIEELFYVDPELVVTP